MFLRILYCIFLFRYGQTGSGKTYTLEGTNDHPGVAPLILENLAVRCKMGHIKKVKFCCIEDYQQNIYDLLDSDKDKKIKVQYITGRPTKIVGAKQEIVVINDKREEEITNSFFEIYKRASRKYIL